MIERIEQKRLHGFFLMFAFIALGLVLGKMAYFQLWQLSNDKVKDNSKAQVSGERKFQSFSVTEEWTLHLCTGNFPGLHFNSLFTLLSGRKKENVTDEVVPLLHAGTP